MRLATCFVALHFGALECLTATMRAHPKADRVLVVGADILLALIDGLRKAESPGAAGAPRSCAGRGDEHHRIGTFNRRHRNE